MRCAALLLAICALAGCGGNATPAAHEHAAGGTQNDPPSARPMPPVSVYDASPDFNGLGPLRWGMDAAQMRKAWTRPLYGAPAANDPDACYYLRPRKDDHGLLLMLEGGRFVRVDVKTESKTAPGGGRVGMRIDELRKLYAGRIKTSPNFYDSAATDLRVTPPHDEPVLLLFEANEKGVVTSWRVGEPQQVNYVEGCS